MLANSLALPSATLSSSFALSAREAALLDRELASALAFSVKDASLPPNLFSLVSAMCSYPQTIVSFSGISEQNVRMRRGRHSLPVVEVSVCLGGLCAEVDEMATEEEVVLGGDGHGVAHEDT